MSEALTRTCHLCGKEIESRVWYSTVTDGKRRKGRRKRTLKAPTRVYACPACFFERLEEDERGDYQRESLGGLFTKAST